MTAKKDTTKTEQAKLDAEKVEAAKVAEAKAEAEKAEQAKAEQAKLDAEQAEADAKAKVKDGKTYIAQWTLHHDNTRYVTGDTLTLSDDDAEDLVDAGVLVAAK